MYSISKNSGRTSYGIQHYTMDSLEDLKNLKFNCAMGSTAYIIETSETFVLNSKNEWVLHRNTNTPESPEETVIVYDGGNISNN